MILATTNYGVHMTYLAMALDGLVDSSEVFSLKRAGIKAEHVSGGTAEQIAMKRAMKHHKDGQITIGFDTELQIRALDGRPGVLSSVWLGRDASLDDITNGTLKRLEGVPMGNREAIFRSSVVMIDQKGRKFHFVGAMPGQILTGVGGTCRLGTPYGSIFKPHTTQCILGQLSDEEYMKSSHLGTALGKLRRQLQIKN